MAPKVKPLLRWAGSKRKLVPTIIEKSPATFNTYFEPFVGSAALFIALAPKNNLLSDFNSELIEFYDSVKNRPWVIYNRTKQIKVSKTEYYKIRAIDPKTLTKIERAIRFLYLNRNCFNGVYRTNMQNKFNVPMGTKTGEFPSEEAYKNFVDLIKTANFKACDYRETLKLVRKNDFVYLDPPYAKSEDRNRGEYGPSCFSSADLDTLVESLKTLDARKAKFCLSYSNNKELRKLLTKSWKVSQLSVPRSVAGFSADRSTAAEVLVTNY